MYDRLLGLERVLHENVKVAFEDIVIVQFVPLAALAQVYRGQLIPGNRRQLVMHQMEIVVQKEHREYRFLDNNRAPFWSFRPTVLAE